MHETLHGAENVGGGIGSNVAAELGRDAAGILLPSDCLLISRVSTRGPSTFTSSLAGSVIGLSALKEAHEASASCLASTRYKSSFKTKP